MPFVLRPYHRFPVRCWVIYYKGAFKGHGMVWNLSSTGGCRIYGDLPLRPGDTLSLTITLPNRKRIEIPEAIVRWSREEAFGVENVMSTPQTNALLQHHVTRLAPEPPEVVR